MLGLDCVCTLPAILSAVTIVVSALLWVCSGTATRSQRRRVSPNFEVKTASFATDDPIYKFVSSVVEKEDLKDIDVNTRVVREATQIISPITATSKEVFALHRCMAVNDKIDCLIKMSVHYNLFSRAIKALGTQKHLQVLQKMTEKKELGSFALTEIGAGVLSGFVVETEARWDEKTKEFIINTPHKRARKYWISQGRSADYILVYATILCGDNKCGTHAFLLRINDYKVEMGEFGFIDRYFEQNDASGLKNSIIVEDVRVKNSLQGTDNVIMHFCDVRVGSDALLDANYTIDDMISNKKAPSFFRQMSSLVSGRICIAAAMLEGLKGCYLYVDNYVSVEREIYASHTLQRVPLKRLAHISALMDEIAFYIEKMEIYLQNVENEFASIFDNHESAGNQKITYAFLERVNVCKAFIPQTTIKYMREMTNVIGAKVYDVESPLYGVERAFVGTIAEGDSTLLAIKLAGDKLKYGKFYESNLQEIKLKFDYWMNSGDKKKQVKWYLDHTDILYKMGMEIAEKQITSAIKV